MSNIEQWIWRRRRNQAFGFWENREGERVGPIPLDEHGRAAFVPSTDCQGAVEERDRYREALKQINAYERPFEPWELRRIARDALLHGIGGQ